MKKMLCLLLLALGLQVSMIAQSPAEPSDNVSGQITLSDNSTVSGSFQDNIRKKGELVLVNAGKKVKYKAGDITSASLGSSNYITWNYTFYEVLWTGSKYTLLRKASEPSGVQYNGAEAIAVNSEGKIDDLFIRTTAGGGFVSFSKKNWKETLSALCKKCDNATLSGSFNADFAKNVLQSCDACQ